MMNGAMKLTLSATLISTRKTGESWSHGRGVGLFRLIDSVASSSSEPRRGRESSMVSV